MMPYQKVWNRLIQVTGMTEELKPCPFCGDLVEINFQRLRSPHIPRTVYFIYCATCLQEFFYSSVNKNKIIDKWNTRHE